MLYNKANREGFSDKDRIVDIIKKNKNQAIISSEKAIAIL